MLVISRKCEERIVLELEDGRIIDLVITEIRGDKVRLGIDAPRTIRINRKELIWQPTPEAQTQEGELVEAA